MAGANINEQLQIKSDTLTSILDLNMYSDDYTYFMVAINNSTHRLEIEEGSYTVSELGIAVETELQKINPTFNVVYDPAKMIFTISTDESIGPTFYIYSRANRSLLNLLGFKCIYNTYHTYYTQKLEAVSTPDIANSTNEIYIVSNVAGKYKNKYTDVNDNLTQVLSPVLINCNKTEFVQVDNMFSFVKMSNNDNQTICDNMINFKMLDERFREVEYVDSNNSFDIYID